MPAAISEYCRQTGQPQPDGAGVVHARDPGEPRVQVPVGPRIARGVDRSADSTEIRIIGGGSRNRLSQSVDRGRDRPDRDRRSSGSDRARQHRRADDRDGRGRVARRSARGHRSVVSRRTVRTARRRSLGRRNTAAFNSTWSSPVPDTAAICDASTCRISGTSGDAAALGEPAARAAALPFEPARRRSAHHELRRRQHQLEVRRCRIR